MKQEHTTYINHACWHQCLCSWGLHVGGNQSNQRKQRAQLGDHMTMELSLIVHLCLSY